MAILDWEIAEGTKGVDFIPFFPINTGATTTGTFEVGDIALTFTTYNAIKKSTCASKPLIIGIPPSAANQWADGVLLQEVSDLASVETLPNSWFYDGANGLVYVNTIATNYASLKAFSKSSIRFYTPNQSWVYKTSEVPSNFIMDFFSYFTWSNSSATARPYDEPQLYFCFGLPSVDNSYLTQSVSQNPLGSVTIITTSPSIPALAASSSNGSYVNIDGYNVKNGETVLVTGISDGIYNGLYTMSITGTTPYPWALAKTTSYNGKTLAVNDSFISIYSTNTVQKGSVFKVSGKDEYGNITFNPSPDTDIPILVQKVYINDSVSCNPSINVSVISQSLTPPTANYTAPSYADPNTYYDGVPLANGDLVLCMNCSDPSLNGLYTTHITSYTPPTGGSTYYKSFTLNSNLSVGDSYTAINRSSSGIAAGATYTVTSTINGLVFSPVTSPDVPTVILTGQNTLAIPVSTYGGVSVCYIEGFPYTNQQSFLYIDNAVPIKSSVYTLTIPPTGFGIFTKSSATSYNLKLANTLISSGNDILSDGTLVAYKCKANVPYNQDNPYTFTKVSYPYNVFESIFRGNNLNLAEI